MWTIVEHDCKGGGWKKGATYESFHPVGPALNEALKSNADTFVFWDGPVPSEPDAQNEIFQKAFELNGERLLRVILDADVKRTENTTLASCSGDCFCVVANGKRRCEGKYCNAAGLCWWVDCGSSC